MTTTADLVLKNATIYTVDDQRSWAQAIAIKGDIIIFVGSDKEVESYISPITKVTDLEGKLVLPGFVDAHAHPSHAMDFVSNISLYLLDSLEDYKKEINNFTKNHPDRAFFRGSGWSDSLFPNLGPSKSILDALIPDKPVALVSYDGHSLWVNSVTLERAGINKDTPDPAGGLIERDPETGETSGVLRETADELVDEVIPDYTLEERKTALLAYQDMAAKVGITLAHDAMLDLDCIEAFNALLDENKLKIRFRGSIEMEPDLDINDQIDLVLKERHNNNHPFFQTNAAKIFVDGVVEGGTAFLLEPYSHKPDFKGLPIWESDVLKSASVALDKAGVQIHLHVIGDAAARISLDALEVARDQNGKRDSRHSITHLQLVEENDIQRFRELDVIGLPQPFWFKIDDYYNKLALPYLGKERADKQYPMQSFIDAGVVMASSSDFPVTIPFDPVIAIQRGITRTAVDNTSAEILWPAERTTLEEMILSYTYNGAFANFLEKEIGSLEAGKQADLVVLDQNLFEIPTENITKSKVLLTLVAGKEIYKSTALE